MNIQRSRPKNLFQNFPLHFLANLFVVSAKKKRGTATGRGRAAVVGQSPSKGGIKPADSRRALHSQPSTFASRVRLAYNDPSHGFQFPVPRTQRETYRTYIGEYRVQWLTIHFLNATFPIDIFQRFKSRKVLTSIDHIPVKVRW